jgi:hypothetical protein
VSATGIFVALCFAGVGAWNLWLAWRRGRVTAGAEYLRRRDNLLVFWVGVVAYSLFLLGGVGFLLLVAFARSF